MRIVRETAVAGKVIYRNIKVPSGNHRTTRAPKKNITKDKVQKNNDRLAVKDLMLKLDNNFDDSCAHIVFTYKIEPSKKQAAKDRKKIVKNLRKELKKLNIDLKYIAVTEYENTRIHHHFVINTQNIDLVTTVWPESKGFVNFKPLDSSGDYYKLAEYLIKETTKTFRLPGSEHKRRYTCSRNIKTPVIKREFVDIAELEEDPEPLTGYYIPKDRVRRYQHPITELEHLEYLMVALGDPRKYKVWPRGKAVTRREYYRVNYEEVQQDLFDFDV